jgi:phage regulator Rha-like protein
MLSSNAIAIAQLFGKRHTNIRWKDEKDIYAAGIQSLEFSF